MSQMTVLVAGIFRSENTFFNSDKPTNVHLRRRVAPRVIRPYGSMTAVFLFIFGKGKVQK